MVRIKPLPIDSCAAMEKLGCTVTKLPVDKFGTVNPDDLQEKILTQARIISVILTNNEVGTIQPVKSLMRIAYLITVK